MMGKIFRQLSTYTGPLCCAIGVVAVIAVYAAYQPAILSPFGLTSLANVSMALAFAAIGQTIVLMAGGLDLSIGAEISLVNCFAATVMGTDSASSSL